jgi:hypothetical protein
VVVVWVEEVAVAGVKELLASMAPFVIAAVEVVFVHLPKFENVSDDVLKQRSEKMSERKSHNRRKARTSI